MKNHAITAFRMLSLVFLLLMAVEAPRGQVLAAKTVPTVNVLKDRFTHYKYTGHMMCDLGRMVGLCGDVGSLTKRGSGGF